ncbi:hypothetical protein PPERSA_01069 [Pseudocohnilembus persalinus]|uniref:Uncharacterized protein n=1 Tax=Pseudocohnilembus persalinus TaxID=266149 RepID=A0A0V0QUS2_PSEPJ|nr:hypothetical protein PPERSA_01069 [Pseudocohnilembus persalinus]|eukprot:KRX05991.1 hypothetical protein PPERSA_01069 [Pseudocohnilembus persalinus]
MALSQCHIVFQQYKGKHDGLVNIFPKWINIQKKSFQNGKVFAFYYNDEKLKQRQMTRALVGIMISEQDTNKLDKALESFDQEIQLVETPMPELRTLQVDFKYRGIPTCFVVYILQIKEKILKIFKKTYPHADYQGHFEMFDFKSNPNIMSISIPYDEDNAVFIKQLYN